MKKFLLLTIGFEMPTPEIMHQWNDWFASFQDQIVEQVGLMNGKEVANGNTTDLEMDKQAITGYLVINAENMEAAVEIAEKCPAITSTRVYEIRSH